MIAQSPPSPTHRSTTITSLAFVLLAIVVLLFGFLPLQSSHDEWWHLKSGAYIMEHGLPTYDIFTYTAATTEWHNHEWLTQCMLWLSYRWGEASGWGGVRGVITLKTLWLLLTFVGFSVWLARRMQYPALAALAGALACALARRTFYPRPPFVSYLLLAFCFGLLLAWHEGRLRARYLCILPFIFALWSNMHGGWMAGLVLIGAFGADATWEWGLAAYLGEDTRPHRRRWGQLLVLGLASIMGTLCNPYGIGLYALAGRVMDDPLLLGSIGEMLPPDWRFVWVLEGLMLTMLAIALRPVRIKSVILLTVMLLGLHFVIRAIDAPWWQMLWGLPMFAVGVLSVRRPGWVASLLLVLFFAWQALMHVRHLSLLAIFLLPSLAWGLDCWARAWRQTRQAEAILRDRPWEGHRTDTRLQTLTLIILLALTCFWWLGPETNGKRMASLVQGMETRKIIRDTNHWNPLLPCTIPPGQYLVDEYPNTAMDFTLHFELPGPIWNADPFTGYMIWRLAPERYRLFTDNRYDIYGARFFRQQQAVLYGADENYPRLLWQLAPDYFRKHIARRYDFDGTPLAPALPADASDEAIEAMLATEEGPGQLGFFTWRKVLDHWQINTIFAEPVEPASINLVLADDPDWVRVHEDFHLNIWVRRKALTPALRQYLRIMDQTGLK